MDNYKTKKTKIATPKFIRIADPKCFKKFPSLYVLLQNRKNIRLIRKKTIQCLIFSPRLLYATGNPRWSKFFR